jgi:hypothetical protein
VVDSLFLAGRGGEEEVWSLPFFVLDLEVAGAALPFGALALLRWVIPAMLTLLQWRKHSFA